MESWKKTHAFFFQIVSNEEHRERAEKGARRAVNFLRVSKYYIRVTLNHIEKRNEKKERKKTDDQEKDAGMFLST